MEVPSARALALELLGASSRRWQHTLGVACRAETVANVLRLEGNETLVAAAWLHDIGYAEDLAKTGFHQLDGARYLREQGEELLARFCAHHSCSEVEARRRGFIEELLAIPRPPNDLLDALTYCDMTIGPDGQLLSLKERLAEIQSRYGTDHPVSRAIAEAEPRLRAAVGRVSHSANDADVAHTRSKLLA